MYRGGLISKVDLYYQGPGFFYLSGVECGSLSDPPNGVVETTGSTFGSTATYSCDHSFSLVGQSTRVCEDFGSWSGAEPECVGM